MPEIRPLRGIRYNVDRIGRLADVVTQPYDQITDEMEIEYRRRSSYSFVNMVLTHYADGHDRPVEYENARRSAENWLREGILLQDPEPSLYPYFQSFSIDDRTYVRKGFMCCLRLEELGKGGILPHEQTLSKPKADRLELTRRTRRDFEPVFLLYTDRDNQVMKQIEAACGDVPLCDVTDDNQVVHRLWRVSDARLIRDVTRHLRSSTMVIADGHHRYETAYTYRNELGNIAPDHPANYKLVTLVNIADDGLVVLPTHRLVMGLDGFKTERLREKIAGDFDVKAVTRESLGNELRACPSHAYGCYAREAAYLLTARNTNMLRDLLPDRSPAYRDLDVVILHALILERALGIAPEKIEEHVRYQRGLEETLSRVDTGEFQCCFLMNPTRPEQVREVAEHGERMPQKSTDFYPKLISGLVFYDVA